MMSTDRRDPTTNDTQNHKKDGKHMRRWTNAMATGLLGAIFTAWLSSAVAAPGIQVEDAGPTVGGNHYGQTAVDLRVKVLGGHVRIKRRWREGEWQFNPNWASLTFDYAVDNSDRPETISRNGYDYALESGSDPYEYVYDTGRKSIVATDTGYRWRSRRGEWIDYDSEGRVLRYGDRNDVTVTLERDTDGRIVRVRDHLDQLAVTFERGTDGRVELITGRGGRSVDYHYDAEGRLERVTDVRGEDWTYEYDQVAGARVLSAVIDPDDRRTDYVHQAVGGQNQCVPTGGGLWSYGDDGWRWGSVSSSSGGGSGGPTARAAIGGQCKTLYNPPTAYLAAIRDAAGVVKSYRYTWNDQDNHYITAVHEASGRTVQYIKNDEGRLIEKLVNGALAEQYRHGERVTVKVDANGHETRTEYDRWRNPLQITYPDGSTRSYRYNDYGQVTRTVDERGVVTEREYDDNGNLRFVREAVGTPAERVTEYQYDQYGQRTLRRLHGDANTEQAEWVYDYDDYGNLVSVTDPEDYVETFQAYDALGNAHVRIDKREHRWEMDYDNAGNLTAMTNPLTHTTTYEYDGAGNRTAQVDALTTRTAYVYDDAGRLERIIDHLDGETVVTYGDNRQIETVTDPSGHWRRIEYNARGQRAAVVDAAGNRIEYHYGGIEHNAGIERLARVDYPTYTEEYRYDTRGRRTAVIKTTEDGLTQTQRFSYDGAGNRITSTDPAQRTTEYDYDALGRITQITDPMTHTVRHSYDDAGNLLSVENQNQVLIRTFDYNARGEKVTATWPGGETFQYDYDGEGNLVEEIDGKGQRKVYEYDEAGRRDRAEYYVDTTATTPQKTVTFSYNAVNRLTGYDDGVTSATYTYDELHRKTSATVDYGPFTKSSSYDYYANGQKRSLTYPDATTVQFDYNNNGQLTAIDLPGGGTITVNGYEWTAPEQVTLPGGSQQHYDYDGLMRPTRIQAEDPADNPVMDYNYTYDAVGNIEEKATEHGTYTYGYDALDRLTSAQNPEPVPDEAYTYDGAGNRLTSAETQGPWQYNANNQLEGYDDTTFTYDDNGSTVTRTENGETTTYEYNMENRMARAEMPDGTVATYYYDPFGRRLWKEVDGTRTYFFYAEEGLLAEFDGTGQQSRAYGWSPQGPWSTDPVWMKVAGEYHYYANDHLGTPQKMVGAAGAVNWASRFKAFGAALVQTAHISNQLRLPGQYIDRETMFHFNYFRYYDPDRGGYMRSDPIGLDGGLNIYAYAGSNPVRYIDQKGLIYGVDPENPPESPYPPGYREEWKELQNVRCVDCEDEKLYLCIVKVLPSASLDCVTCALVRNPRSCVECAIDGGQAGLCVLENCELLSGAQCFDRNACIRQEREDV